MQESDLYKKLSSISMNIALPSSPAPRSILDYSDLATESAWQQAWDADSRQLTEPHSITAQVWSDAIERCLSENNCAYIPKMDSAIHIDRPIILKSGDRLIAHPEAEIRMIIGSVGHMHDPQCPRQVFRRRPSRNVRRSG